MVAEEDPTMSHIRTTIPDATLLLPLSARPVARQADTRPPWQAALGRWLGRLREREQMRALDARERRDAGLTAYDVAIETRKLPWRD